MDKVLLHDLAARGQVAEIKALMPTANVNGTDAGGETALHRAAANNQTVTIRVLLENKAKIDATDRNGNTSLHKAAENGHSRCISVLVDCGANINTRNKFAETPLHCAVRNNHGEAVHDLLILGASLKVKNIRGQRAKDIAKASEASDAARAIKDYIDKQSIMYRIKNMF